MPTTNHITTPRPTIQEPKTPEKQKQEKGFKPDSDHCKKK